MKEYRILIIEDDSSIAEIEKDYLERESFVVSIVSTGTDGLKKGLEESFDLILLDIMIPDMDGFTVCQKLREKITVPILMITALQSDVDKIRGLGVGADDYVVKPFSPSVLVARIKAHIAQYNRLSGVLSKDISKEVSAGGIKINTETHQVFVHDQEIDLKNKEYELLLFLMRHVDVIYDKESLYEDIWGMDSAGDNATVAVHINRLRKKIEKNPSQPEYIQSVRGAGYRFHV